MKGLAGMLSSSIPDTCELTVSRVMTPSVTLAGTQSTSIQKLTQLMATIKMEGR